MKNKLLHAFVRIGDQVLIADVLHSDGELWLVSEWIESPGGQQRTPARAMRVDQFQPQWEAIQGADVVIDLGGSVPIAALPASGPRPQGTPCVDGEEALRRFGWMPLPRAH